MFMSYVAKIYSICRQKRRIPGCKILIDLSIIIPVSRIMRIAIRSVGASYVEFQGHIVYLYKVYLTHSQHVKFAINVFADAYPGSYSSIMWKLIHSKIYISFFLEKVAQNFY